MRLRSGIAAAGLLVLATGLAGCRSEIPTPSERTLSGRYTLRSVDGQSLPHTRVIEAGREILHAGFIEFDGSLGFRMELEYTVEQGGLEEDDLVVLGSGIWVQYDDEVQLSFAEGGNPLVARVDGSEVSFRSDGLEYRFVK